jgi:hypothetical protein
MEGVPKTEGHRYAVYTFSGYLSGKVKPIMVLDPRAQKVTYTPLGVEWLKEHGYFYLPPYAEATHIVSSRTRHDTLPTFPSSRGDLVRDFLGSTNGDISSSGH